MAVLPALAPRELHRVDFRAGDIVYDFFRGDVLLALRSIGRFELQEQISIGNDDYILRVDGSYNKSISDAERRIEVNFIEESAALSLQTMLQAVFRAAYDKSYGLTYRTGRLGLDWKFYFNGVPTPVAMIRKLKPGDKVVLWAMSVYARKMSRVIYRRHHISLVSRVSRVLRRDGKFRGLRFRAIDMRADLGDGLGRRRRVGILVTLSSRLRIIDPVSRGRFN